MHWLEASEIAFGLLVEGKIPESKVLPEKFYPPYDEGVRAYKNGQNTREDLTQLIGINSMQASHSAVESMNGLGKVNDWIHILEQSAARYQAGERFENYAKKLKRGNEVDWGKITEISKKAQNSEDIDFYTPLSQVTPEGVPFIRTGWPPLDEHMGGLPKTGLVIIGGRPKTGKTYLKTKLSACYVKEHPDKVVANHTLEMLKGQISQRYADTEELTQEQKDRILLRDLPDSPEKVINIASTIENLGMIIIDFADLMITGETTESAMSHIYRTLMLGAKELQCTIILLAQLSGDKGGIPRPNQVRWTRLAEALAYMVLMTYNPNTDYHAEKEEHILPIRPNMAYLCCWLSRGGSKIHKSDFPGAIQIAFKGDKGWGSKTKSTSWYPLNES